MVIFVVAKLKRSTMSKSTNFTGQPILNQLLKFLDKGKIRKIAMENHADRYVKKFSTYNHLVVMLFAAFEGYQSIREVIWGLLGEAHKLAHLGLGYIVKRSTFSEANKRRSSKVFGEIYMSVYQKYASVLADSHLTDTDMKRLYIMDSTTISLFKEILQGVGRLSKGGKRKGGIKAHTIIKADENVPYLIRYSEAAKHDHFFLKEAHRLPKGSIITFDKGYVDYGQYERFTENNIWYVTRLKDNAIYKSTKDFDVQSESAVQKDEEIMLYYGTNKKKQHRARRIVYWDADNKRMFEFISNNFDLTAEKIARIYKKRWQIELLFKQLKQNFPLKYFLGDNENAIEIQIWAAMLANLLITLIKSRIKRSWAFSNMASVIRQLLMNYINLYSFLEDPEGTCRRLMKQQAKNYENSLFPEMRGAYF